MKTMLLSGLGALSLLAFAVPASATITIYVGQPGQLQPDENVLFNQTGFGGIGNPIFGVTNQSSTSVTFLGTETLNAPSGGQARVEALDEGLNSLTFYLTNVMLGFKEVEFDISPISGGGPFQPFGVTVDFHDNFGGVYSTSGVQIGNGSNWFSAIALDSQWINKVVITTAGDVSDVRQIRVGGIGNIPTGGVVPEPATWMMLIAGFGLVGSAMRRRRNTTARITG